MFRPGASAFQIPPLTYSYYKTIITLSKWGKKISIKQHLVWEATMCLDAWSFLQDRRKMEIEPNSTFEFQGKDIWLFHLF